MKWPQQARVTQTIAKNATTIRKGFDEAFDAKAIVDAWFESHPDSASMSTQGGRDWALAHVHVKRKPVELALARTYANGWSLGQSVGKSRILSQINKGVSAQTVDWSTWTPGMEPAAALVRPPKGLKQLLDSRRITISDDVIHTKIDRIGTSLARGLEEGWSTDRTAKVINEVINDPQHALTIARTETTRAVSVATREQYEEAKVELVEWLVAEGCEDCQENADASPIGIDETFPSGDSEPPAHPNCLCAIAPVFDDSELPPADEEVAAEEEVAPEDLVDTIDENYEEVDDAIRADELARYQNYDYELNELLGLKRDDYGLWIKDEMTDVGRAVAGYKSTDYAPLNKYLRQSAEQQQANRHAALAEKMVPNLDKAIETAPPLPGALKTYRGLSGSASFNYLKSLGKGAIFEDKGYSSTSIYKKFANDWVEEMGSSSTKYLLEIENPTGTKGLMLDGLKHNSASIEAEWLLPRGTKFEVLENDQINHILRVRVIND